MCGRITLLADEELADVIQSIRQRREPKVLDSVGMRGGMARGQARVGGSAPIVWGSSENADATSMKWGVTVQWSQKPVFNTRIESALGGSALWNQAIREGRCLLPAATFFETHGTQTVRNPKTGRAVKQAYEFALAERTPLLLACVHDGQGSFSVVTTSPNTAVAPIHPRMPLILRFDEVPLWLEGAVGDLAQLADRTGIHLTSAAEQFAASAATKTADTQLALF